MAGRIGRKPILFISLAGFIVTNVLLAFVNVPLLFIPIRFVEGMLISGLILLRCRWWAIRSRSRNKGAG